MKIDYNTIALYGMKRVFDAHFPQTIKILKDELCKKECGIEDCKLPCDRFVASLSRNQGLSLAFHARMN